MNETRRTSPADSATAIAQWKAAAIEAQMRGDLSKVESCCRAILEDDPENADALHLLGISAASRGDLAGGIGLVTRAIANSAEPAGYCISLGGMLRQQGNHAAAAAAFARAATLREGFALAECEQGVSLLDDGRHGEALAPLARALQNDPDLARAHYFLAVAAAEAGRNAALADATESILPAGGPDATMISVIICSIDDAKFERVSRNYATLLAGTPYEIIRIPDARSLCEGYNRGVRQSRGDLLVFSHDDIEILTTDFAARLRSHLANYDMIGVVGASLVSGSTWISAGWPHCHGKIVHRDRAAGVLESSVYRVVSNVVENIQVFDGLFFAATRAVAETVRFDQENFDGFHLYDLDFSFSAWLAGFRLAVCNDIDIIHDSRGNPPREVIEPYAHKFVAKHQRHFAPVQRVAWDIPIGYFGSIEEIRRAFSLLRQSLGAPQRSLAPPADRALAPRARFVWESLSKSEDANAATYFDSGNYELADMLARPPRLVLEIGCGAGGLGRHVKQKFPGVRVYGVELNRTAAEIAATRLDRVFVDSVDSLDLAAAGVAYGSVDTLLLGDVLEHLYDPWGTLVKLRPYLSDDAQVVASIPNSRNLALLSGLAEGDWQYQTSGLLDVTHIRFFTLAGMRRLFSETGYAVHRHHAVLDPRFEGLLREAGRPGGGGVRIGRLQLDHFTEQDVEELCAVQYRILAYPLRQPV